MLQAIGAADASGRVRITLAAQSGASVEIDVTPRNPLQWSTVSVFDNALRALTQGPGTPPALGHDTIYLVVAAIAWCAGIAVVFAAITLRLYKRT